MNARIIITAYLLLQAVGTTAWWFLLLAIPSSVQWFQPVGWPEKALLGFWMADGLLIILGSLFTAYWVYKNRPAATLAIWMLAATTWYPALYCIGASAITGEAWIASGLMSCMAGLTLSMATIYGTEHSPAMFRSATLRPASAVGWTFAQMGIFWTVFLWVIPMAILESETHLGLPRFAHFYQSIYATAMFVAASALGLWSAWTMATCGAGTPLPTATASTFVFAGPYRWVRNPMAVAGIAQGAAVGWWLGSFSIIAYALAGIIVWHVAVRPSEEADLQSRFGDEYLAYQESVRLWIPRLPTRDA